MEFPWPAGGPWPAGAVARLTALTKLVVVLPGGFGPCRLGVMSMAEVVSLP